MTSIDVHERAKEQVRFDKYQNGSLSWSFVRRNSINPLASLG
jgi:hypothetical protein